MTIVIGGDSVAIVAPKQSVSIVSSESDVSIVSPRQSVSIISPKQNISVIAPVALTSLIVGSGIQGLKGEKGDAATGSTMTATQSVGGHRVIMGNGQYADNTDLSTAGRAIGVTANSAIAGDIVTIVNYHELSGFSSLLINSPLYLSTSGTITQSLPTAGYVQQVGVAITSDKAMIFITLPFVKA